MCRYGDPVPPGPGDRVRPAAVRGIPSQQAQVLWQHGSAGRQEDSPGIYVGIFIIFSFLDMSREPVDLPSIADPDHCDTGLDLTCHFQPLWIWTC